MILLGWNPDRGDAPFPSYRSAAEHVRERGVFRCSWLLPRRPVPVDTEAWLFLQGARGRGLIGHGRILSSMGPQGAGQEQTSGVVEFDALLQRGDCIPQELLSLRVPGIAWGTNRSSRRIPAAAGQALRALWSEQGTLDEADPLIPPPGTLPQDALALVPVNRYEKDPHARRVCLAHHGTACAVCGFSFEEAFGPVGRDFLHVHHLVPSSCLVAGYELDAVSDLVPLCPNCHSMAHRRLPEPYSPAELRAMRSAAGFLAGTALSPAELTAQDDAARILGAG